MDVIVTAPGEAMAPATQRRSALPEEPGEPHPVNKIGGDAAPLLIGELAFARKVRHVHDVSSIRA